MPAKVEKIPNQPIVVVNYYGQISVEDIRAVFAQVAGLLLTYGAPIYRITCVESEKVTTSFDEVMMMTTLSSKGIPGSTTDPNVTTVLVGDHLLIDLYADAMRQDIFGGVDIPIFDRVDEAMDYVHILIAQDSSSGNVRSG